jgi:predicted ATPase
MWHDITRQTGGNIISVTIPVMFGRYLEIPKSCNGVARFDFEYLCGRPVISCLLNLHLFSMQVDEGN